MKTKSTYPQALLWAVMLMHVVSGCSSIERTKSEKEQATQAQEERNELPVKQAPKEEENQDKIADEAKKEKEVQERVAAIEDCPGTTAPSMALSEEKLKSMEKGLQANNGLVYQLLKRERFDHPSADSACIGAGQRLPTVGELQEGFWIEDIGGVRCGNHDYVAWSSEKEGDKARAVKLDNAKAPSLMPSATLYHLVCVHLDGTAVQQPKDFDPSNCQNPHGLQSEMPVACDTAQPNEFGYQRACSCSSDLLYYNQTTGLCIPRPTCCEAVYCI